MYRSINNEDARLFVELGVFLFGWSGGGRKSRGFLKESRQNVEISPVLKNSLISAGSRQMKK